ncbi:DUF4811 domain-containing protein [Weissella minor]|uniref:DUF4811 domain-containing protein n=1 Tax=Weissella minor TaxID=1620 RepID=UPI00070CACD7|nr:DUF4811 domain-containing protein [Weissella minor]
MIVLLVLGIVFLLYTLLQYTQHREVRWIPLVLGIVLIAGNLWGLHVADDKHLFMTRNEESRTEKIEPAAQVGKYNFITTQKIGDNKRYTYQLNDKSYQTLAKNTTMTLKTGSPATLKTSVTTFVESNVFDRFMRLGKNSQDQADTAYTMTVPKDWHIVSTDQFDKLEKIATASDENLSDNVAKRVKDEYARAYDENHNFLKDKNAQKKLQDKIVADETKKSEEKINKQIEKQLKDWNIK